MKYIFSIILFLSFSEVLHAQQKIYFDENWEVTTPENMEYYRETYKEGNLIRIKDFYKNGQIQMDATVSDASLGSEVFEGEVKWYFPNGKVETIEHYKNGKSVGIYKTFNQEGKIIKDYNYTASGIFSGKFYKYKDESTIFNSISEFEHGENIKTSYFGNDFSMPFKEVYPNDIYKSETKFYDEKGKFIGTLFGKESRPKKGIFVEYFSNPLSVRNIKEYITNHDLKSEKAYYSNGYLKFEYTKEGENTKFYDQKGVLIGEYYRDTVSNRTNGVDIGFFKEEEFSDIIRYKCTIEDGRLTFRQKFHNNSVMESEDFYVEKKKSKTVFYNKEGVKRFQIKYYRGKPYEGTLDNYKGYEVTYAAGIIVGIKFFNYDDCLRFEKKYNPSSKEFDGIVYDDKGRLKYKFSNKYYTQQYNFNGVIISYFEGKKIGEGSFVDGVLTKGIAVMDNEGQRVDFQRKGTVLNLKYYGKDNTIVIREKNIKITELGDCKRIHENDLFSVYGNWKEKREKNGTGGYTEDCREYKRE